MQGASAFPGKNALAEVHAPQEAPSKILPSPHRRTSLPEQQSTPSDTAPPASPKVEAPDHTLGSTCFADCEGCTRTADRRHRDRKESRVAAVRRGCVRPRQWCHPARSSGLIVTLLVAIP